MKHIQYFLVPYGLVFTVILAALFQYPKMELHLLMNAHHTATADWFFRVLTEVGGGSVPFVFIGLLLFYRYSAAVYLLASQLVGGIVSVIGKRAFDAPRPLLYFQQQAAEIALPAVDGVHLHTVHSFPSGHTITAFALFFGLSLLVKNKWLKLLFFILAALAGYSRVYLSQHFTADILAGSAIGIAAAWACIPLLKKMESAWGNRSLSDIFSKNKAHAQGISK